MSLSLILNLVGLILITIGSIFAGICTPAPSYSANGEVSMSEPDLEKRKGIYRGQKMMPFFYWLISAGAILQAIALFVK